MRNLDMFEVDAVSGVGWLKEAVKAVIGTVGYDAGKAYIGSLNRGETHSRRVTRLYRPTPLVRK